MMNSKKRYLAVVLVFVLGLTLSLAFPGAPSLGQSKAKPAAAPKPTKFKPVCAQPNYPSPPPAQSPRIDAICGLAGAGTGAEARQDTAKNNFCATGTPQPITIDDLISLQKQVEKNPAINFGNANTGKRKKGPTTNRALLRTLGEGKLVTLNAFVVVAHAEGPESVNCGKNVPGQVPFHDIHISLGAAADVPECAGVVAEMSPHHRPDAWTHANVEKVSTLKLPVRVTGHLYFDSSHVPCSNGVAEGGQPKRISLWEIHPIYKFEVCTGNCDGAGTWVTLDEWAKQQK